MEKGGGISSHSFQGGKKGRGRWALISSISGVESRKTYLYTHRTREKQGGNHHTTGERKKDNWRQGKEGGRESRLREKKKKKRNASPRVRSALYNG